MFFSNFFLEMFGAKGKKLYLCIRFRERTTLEANTDRAGFERSDKEKSSLNKIYIKQRSSTRSKSASRKAYIFG